jgi:hypothetical protein
MNLLGLTPNVPNIIDRWTLDVEAVLLRDGVQRGDTACIIGQLRDLARQVSYFPPTPELGCVLLDNYEALKDSEAARSPSGFLLAEYFVKKGEPTHALAWNEGASKNLNGTSSPLTEAALLSQELTIRLQQNDLKEAENLRERIVDIELQEDELALFEAPLRNLDITLQYESGEWDKQRVTDLMDPLPQFYREFLLGRFHLQYRRERKALEEFDSALELFKKEKGTGYSAFKYIIALHRARALYQQNHLKEAGKLFEELLPRFVSLGLAGAQLRAKIGIASIQRINHDYSGSEENLLATLREAKNLGLKKTSFHACVSLAILRRDLGQLGEARASLEEAETYLNPQNKKHLCTLNMQWGELEYDLRNAAAGDRYFNESESLLTTNQEEALLLRATMAFHEARYKMRIGQTRAARELLHRRVEELTVKILNNPASEYRDESSPRYLLGKLLRLDAYCALKENRPLSALESCKQARALNKQDDLRSLSKITFWEALAYARLGELEQAQVRLEEVAKLSEDLGIAHPIRDYLDEAEQLDGSVYVEQLAISISNLLRGSELCERFRPFEQEFVQDNASRTPGYRELSSSPKGAGRNYEVAFEEHASWLEQTLEAYNASLPMLSEEHAGKYAAVNPAGVLEVSQDQWELLEKYATDRNAQTLVMAIPAQVSEEDRESLVLPGNPFDW